MVANMARLGTYLFTLLVKNLIRRLGRVSEINKGSLNILKLQQRELMGIGSKYLLGLSRF